MFETRNSLTTHGCVSCCDCAVLHTSALAAWPEATASTEGGILYLYICLYFELIWKVKQQTGDYFDLTHQAFLHTSIDPRNPLSPVTWHVLWHMNLKQKKRKKDE